jgi:hypothetical protein
MFLLSIYGSIESVVLKNLKKKSIFWTNRDFLPKKTIFHGKKIRWTAFCGPSNNVVLST